MSRASTIQGKPKFAVLLAKIFLIFFSRGHTPDHLLYHPPPSLISKLIPTRTHIVTYPLTTYHLISEPKTISHYCFIDDPIRSLRTDLFLKTGHLSYILFSQTQTQQDENASVLNKCVNYYHWANAIFYVDG